MTSRYAWRISLLALLCWGAASCTGLLPHKDLHENTPTTEASVPEGWISLNLPVRDAQIAGSLVLLNNFAPLWGQGPGDGEPFVVAFDPHIQRIVWEAGYISSTPVVANSQSIFIVEQSHLVAIDLDSGKDVWQVPFTGSGSPQVSCDDDLVLAANEEMVFAFDAGNGGLSWESDLPVPLDPFVPLVTSFTSWREHGALSKHNNTVYVRRLDYRDSDECRFSLLALDANSGDERWRFPIQQPSRGECLPGTLPLAYAEGMVLVATFDAFPDSCVLNALDEDNGEGVWSYWTAEHCSTGTRLFSSDDALVLTSAEGLAALRMETGRLLWQQEYSGSASYEMVPDRGWIARLSGDFSNRVLSLIDLHSGETLDELEVPSPESCASTSTAVGFSKNQFVLLAGDCVRSVKIGEDGSLIP